MKYIKTLFFVFLCFVQITAFAENEVEKQTRNLKKLRLQIAAIQKTIEQDTGIKNRYINELRQLDKKISLYTKKIRQLNRQQIKLNKRSNKLRNTLKVLTRKLKKQQKVLSRQIVSSYKVGHQQTLQIVLNQQSADAVSRMLTYASYLSKARSQKIKSTRMLSEKIRSAVAELELKQQELQENHKLLSKNKQSFSASYQNRQKLLKQISKSLMKKNRNLAALENNSKRLQELIKSLGELLFDIPPPPQELIPFSKLKGKLSWPVKGKILHRFRERKTTHSLYWKGIVVKSRPGKEVKAIYPGRVVFADWLNGFGNIIIIDHGDGYLSLYAYNRSLEKELGEWVNKGDVISTVGRSGGQSQTALYFEIRKKGKPVNPLKWIKKS